MKHLDSSFLHLELGIPSQMQLPNAAADSEACVPLESLQTKDQSV